MIRAILAPLIFACVAFLALIACTFAAVMYAHLIVWMWRRGA